MSAYTNASSVRALITDSGLSTDTSYDTILNELINSASLMIERHVGGWDNYFSAPSAVTTRYYDGDGTATIDIDPAVSITAVAVAENGGRLASDYTAWVVDTDYYLYPYNRLPIRSLIVEGDSDKGGFARSRKSVKVTGRFGYSADVPADIAMACRIQVSRWFMRGKGAFMDASAAANVGQIMYAKELDPDVKQLLKPYVMMNEGL